MINAALNLKRRFTICKAAWDVFWMNEEGFFSLPIGFFSAPSSTLTQCIQSIQQVSIAIASGATSGTATISSVTTGNCALFYQGIKTTQTTSGTIYTSFISVALTNSTTVTATSDGLSGTGNAINATVVQFVSAAINTSTQSGTINLSSTSNTATISAVGSNAFVLWNGAVANGASSLATSNTGVSLSGTTVTAHVNTAGGMFVNWMVVDLKSSVISAIQSFAVTLTSGNTSDTYTPSPTISSINNLLTIYNGMTSSNANLTNSTYAYQMSSGPVTLNLFRDNTNTGTRTLYGYLISFNTNVLNGNVQRGSITVTTTATTATISTSSTSKTLANFNGNSSNNNTPNTTLATLTQTNSTTLTGSVEASGGSSTLNWETALFN